MKNFCTTQQTREHKLYGIFFRLVTKVRAIFIFCHARLKSRCGPNESTAEEDGRRQWNTDLLMRLCAIFAMVVLCITFLCHWRAGFIEKSKKFPLLFFLSSFRSGIHCYFGALWKTVKKRAVPRATFFFLCIFAHRQTFEILNIALGFLSFFFSSSFSRPTSREKFNIGCLRYIFLLRKLVN